MSNTNIPSPYDGTELKHIDPKTNLSYKDNKEQIQAARFADTYYNTGISEGADLLAPVSVSQTDASRVFDYLEGRPLLARPGTPEWNKTMHEYQSNGAAWANAAMRTVGGGAVSVLENLATLDTVFYEGSDKYEKSISKVFSDIKADIREATPIYQSDPNMTMFEGGLTNGAWWLNTGSDLAQSIIGFIGAGYVTGGTIGSFGHFLKGKKALDFFKSVGAVDELYAAGIDLTSTVGNAVILNHMEATIESADVFKQVVDHQVNVNELNEEAAKKIASEAAATTYRLNKWNILLNLTSASQLLKAGKSGFLRTSQRYADDIAKAKKNVKPISIASEIARESGQEYIEENVNLYASKAGIAQGTGKERESFLDAVFSMEGLESGILGFIGGFVQTGLTKLVTAPAIKASIAKKEAILEIHKAVETGIEKALDLAISQDPVERSIGETDILLQATLTDGDWMEKYVTDIESMSEEEASNKGYNVDSESDNYYKKKAASLKNELQTYRKKAEEYKESNPGNYVEVLQADILFDKAVKARAELRDKYNKRVSELRTMAEQARAEDINTLREATGETNTNIMEAINSMMEFLSQDPVANKGMLELAQEVKSDLIVQDAASTKDERNKLKDKQLTEIESALSEAHGYVRATVEHYNKVKNADIQEDVVSRPKKLNQFDAFIHEGKEIVLDNIKDGKYYLIDQEDNTYEMTAEELASLPYVGNVAVTAGLYNAPDLSDAEIETRVSSTIKTNYARGYLSTVADQLNMLGYTYHAEGNNESANKILLILNKMIAEETDKENLTKLINHLDKKMLQTEYKDAVISIIESKLKEFKTEDSNAPTPPPKDDVELPYTAEEIETHEGMISGQLEPFDSQKRPPENTFMPIGKHVEKDGAISSNNRTKRTFFFNANNDLSKMNLSLSIRTADTVMTKSELDELKAAGFDPKDVLVGVYVDANGNPIDVNNNIISDDAIQSQGMYITLSEPNTVYNDTKESRYYYPEDSNPAVIDAYVQKAKGLYTQKLADMKAALANGEKVSVPITKTSPGFRPDKGTYNTLEDLSININDVEIQIVSTKEDTINGIPASKKTLGFTYIVDPRTGNHVRLISRVLNETEVETVIKLLELAAGEGDMNTATVFEKNTKTIPEFLSDFVFFGKASGTNKGKLYTTENGKYIHLGNERLELKLDKDGRLDSTLANKLRQYLPTLYINVNAKSLNTSKQYNGATVKDGKLVPNNHPSYKQYLLTGEQPILKVDSVPQTNDQDNPLSFNSYPIVDFNSLAYEQPLSAQDLEAALGNAQNEAEESVLVTSFEELEKQPVNNLESKIADIEKRRQEELDRYAHDIIERVEDYEVVDYNGDTLFVQIRYKKDRSKEVLIGIKKNEYGNLGIGSNTYIVDAFYTDLYEKVIKTGERTAKEANLSRRTDRINAKYDAEIEALKTEPVEDLKVEIERKRQKELKDAPALLINEIDLTSSLLDINAEKQQRITETEKNNYYAHLTGFVIGKLQTVKSFLDADKKKVKIPQGFDTWKVRAEKALQEANKEYKSLIESYIKQDLHNENQLIIDIGNLLKGDKINAKYDAKLEAKLEALKTESVEPVQESKPVEPAEKQSKINVKTLEDLDTAEDLNDKDSFFRLVEPSYEAPITQEEIAKVQELLPQFPVEVVSKLIEDKAWGSFGNGIITLYEAAETGTGYHEAFHAVSQYIITPRQRQKLYNEYRAKTNQPSLSNKDVEEALAEDFREFMLGRPVSYFKSSKQKSLFRKILDTILEWIGLQPVTIENVFNNISQGKYRNSKPKSRYSEFNTLYSEFLSGKDLKFKHELMEGLDYIFFKLLANSSREADLRNITNGESVDHIYLTTKAYGFQRLYLVPMVEQFSKKHKISDLVNSRLGNLKTLKGKDLTIKTYEAIEFLESYKEDNNVSNEFISDLDTIINMSDQVADILNNWDEVVQMHKDHLALNQFIEPTALEDSDVEIGKAGDPDNDWANHAFLFSVKNSASTYMKFLMSAIPKTRIVDGKEVYVKNDLGFKTNYNFAHIFAVLAKRLAGATNEKELQQRLDLLKKQWPAIGYINKIFPSKVGINVSAEEVSRRVQFEEVFTKQFVNYWRAFVGKDGYFDLFDAGLDSAKMMLTSKWSANAIASRFTKDNTHDISAILEHVFGTSNLENNDIVFKNHLDKASKFTEAIGIEFSNPEVAFTNDVVEKTLSNIAKAFLKMHKKNQTTWVYDNSEFSNYMQELIKAEKALGIDNIVTQHRSLTGENVYDIVFHHFMSVMIDEFNNTTDKQYPEWLAKIMNDPYAKNSIIKTRKEKSGTPIEFIVLEGSKERSDKNGVPFSRLSEADRFHLIFNNTIKGVYHLLRTSDNSVERVFNAGEQLIDPADAAAFVNEGNKQPIFDIFKGYLKDELLWHSRAEQDLKNVKNYDSSKFGMLMSYLITDPQIKEYYDNKISQAAPINEERLNDFVNLPFVEAAIERFISDKINETIELLLKHELIVLHKDIYLNNGIRTDAKDGPDQKNKKAFTENQVVVEAAVFALNYMASHIEQTKLFFGNPVMYKNIEDLYKRLSGPIGPKRVPSTNSSVLTWVNKNLKRQDKKQLNTTNPTISTLVVQDVTVSRQYKDATALANNVKAYSKINWGDASGMVSLDFYRQLLFLTGQWSPEQEAAYQWQIQEGWNKDYITIPKNSPFESIRGKRITSEDAYANGSLLVPLKPQGFGPNANKELFSPVFHKLAVFPLLPELFKDNPKIQELSNQMKDKQLDLVLFESGVKLGQELNKDGSQNRLFDTEGNITANTGVIMDTYLKFFGIQNDNKPKTKDKVTSGTQSAKQILTDLYDKGAPRDMKFIVNGEPMSGEQVLSDLYAMDAARLSFGRDKLMSDLEVTTNPDGSYNIGNYSALIKILREEAMSRTIPQDIIDSIPYIRTEGLEGIKNSQKAEQVLWALANTRMIDVKRYGNSFVQVPSILFGGTKIAQDKDGKVSIGVSDNLKFYEETEDGISQAEIMIPWHFKTKFKKGQKIDSKLLDVIGFRIPTQGPNSINSYVVKGFLPPSVGNLIVVPPDLPIKNGSDFDWDKEFSYLPEYTIKNGKPVYIEYISEINDKLVQRAFYQILKSEGIYNRFTEDLTNAKNKLEKLKRGYKISKGRRKFIVEKTFDIEALRAARIDLSIKTEYLNELEQRSSTITKTELETEFAAIIEEYSDILDNTLPLDEYIDSIIEILAEDIETNKEYISEYVQARGEQGQLSDDKYLTQIEDTIKEIKQIRQGFFEIAKNVASNYSIATLNGQKAVHNRMNELYKGIITAKDNFSKIISPLDGTSIQEAANQAAYVKETKDTKFKKYEEWKKKKAPAHSLLSPIHNLNTMQAFYESKQGIGISAIHATNHILSTISKLEIRFQLNRTFNFNVDGLGMPNISSIKSADGKNIADLTSQIISAFVDAAKDPYIIKAGVNTQTTGIFMLMVRLGIPIDEVSLILNQPIILDYLRIKKGSNFSDSLSSDKINDALKEKYEEAPEKSNLYSKDQLLSGVAGRGSLSMQADILRTFKQLEAIAEDMFKLTTTATYDTNGLATSLEGNLAILDGTLNLANEVQLIGGVDAYLNGFFKPYKDNFIAATTMFSSLYKSMDSPEFRDLMDSWIKKTKKVIGDNRVKALNKLRHQYLYARLAYAYGITPEVMAQMFHTENTNSLPKVLNRNKTKENFLLDSLESSINRADALIDGVSLRRRSYTPSEINLITESWRQLNEANPKLARNLAIGSIMQSALGYTPTSFVEYMPSEMYNQFIKEALNVQGFNMEQFEKEFIKNNIEDTTIVPYEFQSHYKDGDMPLYDISQKTINTHKITPRGHQNYRVGVSIFEYYNDASAPSIVASNNNGLDKQRFPTKNASFDGSESAVEAVGNANQTNTINESTEQTNSNQNTTTSNSINEKLDQVVTEEVSKLSPIEKARKLEIYQKSSLDSVLDNLDNCN